MAIKSAKYIEIFVESYIPNSNSGYHGLTHIRPLPGQGDFKPEMHVECSKDLSDTKRYPVGTKFRIRAKITDREGGKPFVYSHYSWPYVVCQD
jgi:hypothetical protein